MAVSSLSKEDLYRSFVRMQRRSEKYKAKFVQVMQAYKDVDRERDKLRVSLHTTHDDVNTGSSKFCIVVTLTLQNTLATSQDKAFRRISELKEQIQLDKLAKRHVEENYSLMLEEKGELIKVLQTQVIRPVGMRQ